MSDPWQEFAASHRLHELVSAAITRTTDFGIFVGLEGGIEGLVHLGDISWSEPGEAAILRFAIGDVIDAQILSIDVEHQRISLGIKQVDSPYEAFAQHYAVGEVVIGRVREVDSKALVVDLPGGVAGTVRLSRAKLSRDRFRVEVGDELRLVIVEIWLRHGLIELRFGEDGDAPAVVPVEPSRPPPPTPLWS